MKNIKTAAFIAIASVPGLALGAAQPLIKNPLSKVNSLEGVVAAVLQIVELLLITATVLYLLYAGLMFVTARGEPGKISKARDALLWGMVGAALVLCARIIATTIQGTVSGLLG